MGKYPLSVSPRNYGRWTRLKARLFGGAKVGRERLGHGYDDIYLSFCKEHRLYYLHGREGGDYTLCPRCLLDRRAEKGGLDWQPLEKRPRNQPVNHRDVD